jgi:hypothetical protein
VNSRDVPSSIPVDAAAASARMLVCERRRFNFSNLAPGEELSAILCPAAPCAEYSSAALVVVVHELTISSGEEIRVTVKHASNAKDGSMGTFVVASAAAEISLASATTDTLLIQPLDSPPGTHLQVAVESTRNGTFPVTIAATLTIELLLRTAAAPLVRTDLPQTWTRPQTFNGDGTDTDPAIVVGVDPTIRKLALELQGGTYKLRHYYTDTRIEITVNARWTGSGWVRDATGSAAARYLLEADDFRIQHVPASIAQPFDDSEWAGSSARVLAWDIDSLGAGETLTTGRERDVPSGPLTGYSAMEGEWSSMNSNIGSGAAFASGRLPAAPSSVTFRVYSQSNTGDSPSVWQAQRMGLGWFDETTGVLPSTRSMFLSFSAT